MSTPAKTEDDVCPFLKNIDAFVKESMENPNSLYRAVQPGPNTEEKEAKIHNELNQFAADMRKMMKGTMSYAEMRSLYG